MAAVVDVPLYEYTESHWTVLLKKQHLALGMRLWPKQPSRRPGKPLHLSVDRTHSGEKNVENSTAETKPARSGVCKLHQGQGHGFFSACVAKDKKRVFGEGGDLRIKSI